MTSTSTTASIQTAIAGLVSLVVAMGIGRFAFTPLLPMMLSDSQISIAQGGWLASVHFLGYLIGALFATRLIGSPRRLLSLSLFGIGLSTVGMGLTDSVAIWLFWRFLSGVLSALALVLVSNYFIKALRNQASYQGWVFAGVGTGIAFAGLLCIVFMLTNVNSSVAWLITGVLSIAAAAFVMTLSGHELPTHQDHQSQTIIDRTPVDYTIVIAYGVMGIGYIIPATYLPVIARDIVSDPLTFGWVWPAFGAAAFASTIATARLHQRVSNRVLWACCHGIMAAGLVLSATWQHIGALVIAGLAVGGTFMVITMVAMKEAHQIAASGDSIRHIAIMTAAFAAGQIAGPVLGAIAFDATGGFGLALIVAAGLLVVTSFSLIARQPTRRLTD